jgi:hypothetical protein
LTTHVSVNNIEIIPRRCRLLVGTEGRPTVDRTAVDTWLLCSVHDIEIVGILVDVPLPSVGFGASPRGLER